MQHGDVMKIEIVEFYPYVNDEKKGILKGTLHAYIIDLGMDLRGIYVMKKKHKWFIGLPSKFGLDLETKKYVMYPIIEFTDKNKSLELKKQISNLGRKYIEENYLNGK